MHFHRFAGPERDGILSDSLPRSFGHEGRPPQIRFFCLQRRVSGDENGVLLALAVWPVGISCSCNSELTCLLQRTLRWSAFQSFRHILLVSFRWNSDETRVISSWYLHDTGMNLRRSSLWSLLGKYTKINLSNVNVWSHTICLCLSISYQIHVHYLITNVHLFIWMNLWTLCVF